MCLSILPFLYFSQSGSSELWQGLYSKLECQAAGLSASTSGKRKDFLWLIGLYYKGTCKLLSKQKHKTQPFQVKANHKPGTPWGKWVVKLYEGTQQELGKSA